MNENEYLTQRLDDQIDWYGRKSQLNKKWFHRMHVFQLVAAAAIPFLAGYITPDRFWIKFVIGLLGVMIAIAGAIVGLYKCQENWLEYRTTCESLRHEKYLFLSKVDPYNIEKPFDLLVKRVEGLISKENSLWSVQMKKGPKSEKM